MFSPALNACFLLVGSLYIKVVFGLPHVYFLKLKNDTGYGRKGPDIFALWVRTLLDGFSEMLPTFLLVFREKNEDKKQNMILDNFGPCIVHAERTTVRPSGC